VKFVLLVVVAAAPSLFLLTFFYLKDRYEREPLREILMAFGLGLYAMIAAQGMATTAEGWVSAEWLALGGEWARVFDAFVLSGAIEEFAKWVVLMLAIYHWDEFDEPLDGVVYGVAVALGFATLENFLFVLRLGLGVAWQRALFAVPAHALCGATMGYYAGRAKLGDGNPERAPGTTVGARPAPSPDVAPTPVAATPGGVMPGRTRWPDHILCLLVPIVFHGLYDYALHHGLGSRIWVLISVGSLALWQFVLRRVRRAQSASPFRPAGDR
jgi:RsiW-degrading membrane proteinase PrsW (M82 family)